MCIVLIGGLGSEWRDMRNRREAGKLNTLNYHKIWQRKQNSKWIRMGEQFGKQEFKCFENVQKRPG